MKTIADNFCHVYLNTEDTPYTRAVSRYIWSALAGRAFEPGCQADMAPVLVGAQGLRKTSALRAMAPRKEWFVELRVDDEKEDDMIRKMRGKCIAELSELSAVGKRDIESLKAFISRRDETWIAKYDEFASTFARGCLFFGTTNHMEFLVDETGNRRWLPIIILGMCDVDAIERDREKLWAAGVKLFKAHGVMWQDAERLAKEVHEKHMLPDAWRDAISHWLTVEDEDGVSPLERGHVSTEDILLSGIGIDVKHRDKRTTNRVGSIMRQLGWQYGFCKIKGEKVRAWVKNVELA